MPHLSPLPSEVKVTGVLHSGQARILSKSCEIANCILLDAFTLYAFTRDIGTVSNALEAGNCRLFRYLVPRSCLCYIQGHEDGGIMRPAVVLRVWKRS